MDSHEEQAGRKWIERQLREGVSAATLHEMVDRVVVATLSEALIAERRERHRADAATVERDDLQIEVERLREGVAALHETQERS